MKRQREDEPTGVALEGNLMAKQQRRDENEPWGIGGDPKVVAAGLPDLCERVNVGQGSTAEVAGLLRLVCGSMTTGTSRAREPATSYGGALAQSYARLWGALALDADATDAVRKVMQPDVWPPTFADVQAAYLDTALCRQAALERMVGLDAQAVIDEAGATRVLVKTIGNAARRRQIVTRLGVGSHEGFPLVLSPDWTPFIETHARSDAFGRCDPDMHYYMLCVDVGDQRRMFFMGERNHEDGIVHEIATVATYRPMWFGRVHVAVEKRPQPDDLPDGIDGSEIVDFMTALSASPGDERTLLDATLAGVECMARAMVPVTDADLSDSMIECIMSQYCDAAEARRGYATEWHVRGAWIDACRLAVILRLFRGQLNARQAQSLFAPQSLVDAAAAAYRGPLRDDLLPRDVLDRAAAYAWQTTCAEPADPHTGRLPHAERLLDVARVWGVQPNAAETDRPELLCETLAGRALSEAIELTCRSESSEDRPDVSLPWDITSAAI